MFSRSRINEQGAKTDGARTADPVMQPASPRFSAESREPAGAPAPAAMPKGKPAASVLSSDLAVTGNLRTTGDIVIEGTIDGDIRAHLLTVGESATIRGEILADDIVINGRVIGRVRGLKVRLTSTARVEGDIIHKTIAIESGAHFEGSVQRQDDPLGTNAARPAQQAQAPQAAPQAARPAAPPPQQPRSEAPAQQRPAQQAAPAKNNQAKMPG